MHSIEPGQIVLDDAEQAVAPRYEYEPISEDEIRLVTIGPSAYDEEDLHCFLIPCPRNSGSEYAAVSYTWGDVSRTERIHCNGASLEVTASCAEVLKALRDDVEPRTFWIDAVCIDQQNLKERAVQVVHMGEVYRLAMETLACLGSSDVWYDIETTRSHWNTLFERPWFRRTWIVQELLLSKTITFVIGPQRLGLTDLLHCCSFHAVDLPLLLRMRTDFAHDYANRPPKSWDAPDQRQREDINTDLAHEYAKIPSQSQGVTDQAELRIKIDTDASGRIDLNYWRLPTLLEQTRDFCCQDPRDRLFALLPLFIRPIPQLLRPDYSKSTVQVFEDLSWYLLQEDMPGALATANGRRTTILPSWATDWSQPRVDWLPLRDSAKVRNRAGFPLGGKLTRPLRIDRTVQLRGMLVSTINKWREYKSYSIYTSAGDHDGVLDVQPLPDGPLSDGMPHAKNTLISLRSFSFESFSDLSMIMYKIRNHLDDTLRHKQISVYFLSPDTSDNSWSLGFRGANDDSTFNAVTGSLDTFVKGFRDYRYRTISTGMMYERNGFNSTYNDDAISLMPYLKPSYVSKRFGGLASSPVNMGDEVCILLGFSTPFVVRRINANRWYLISQCEVSSAEIMEGSLADKLNWPSVWSHPCPKPLQDFTFA